MGFFDRLRKLHVPDWGVHPDDRKRPAANLPARIMPAPERLYLPLAQHVGQPGRPVVQVGERVLKGQLLAEPQGNISAPLHSPTSGTILAIGEIVAPHPSGLPVMAITLASDGKDEWCTRNVCVDPFSLAPAELAGHVAAAGVVGLGGATFPAAVKLNLGHRSRIDSLIINGSECEPYLSCDDRLMRERADEVVDGIRLMLHATGAEKALIGIEDNKPEAIAAMRSATANFDTLHVLPVPARYPMGSDRQLIIELTGREVPAESRAADVGVLVHNVGTARAVHRAIRHGEPLISRWMTVNGGATRNPGNIEVPLGSLMEDVLAFAGGLTRPAVRLVMGGPMMGTVLPGLRVPVVKGTSGLLALTAEEVAEQAPGPCIRCGSCVRACPAGLLPLEISQRIAVSDLAGALRLGVKDCITCGCCAYVCPSHIPLVQYFQHAKGELAALDRDKRQLESTRELINARTVRLEIEAKEKAALAARRTAEKEATAKAKAAAAQQAAIETKPTETPASSRDKNPEETPA